MGKKKDFDYFDMFVQAVKFSCKSAAMLEETLKNFDAETLQERMKELHVVEHTADIAKHEMMQELSKAFITPLEREDIMQLIQYIDNVTDAIEDVLMRAYMFNVQSIRDEALDFAKLIVKCCDTMKDAMKEFHNFRKSGSIHESIVEINRLEEEGDKLYMKAVRKLYLGSKDPVELMVWREIFDRLEKCCDACEDVANVVESVIMKNS